MSLAYVALGSNLDQPLQQLRKACTALAALPDSRLADSSHIYRSAAVGPGEQPDYLNAVTVVTTELAPLVLLDALQGIEQAHGRKRGRRWGARTLDLDLLLYGDEVIDLPRLRVPHPGLADRAFVLYPLRDLCPELVLPTGDSLESLWRRQPGTDLTTLDESLDIDA